MARIHNKIYKIYLDLDNNFPPNDKCPLIAIINATVIYTDNSDRFCKSKSRCDSCQYFVHEDHKYSENYICYEVLCTINKILHITHIGTEYLDFLDNKKEITLSTNHIRKDYYVRDYNIKLYDNQNEFVFCPVDKCTENSEEIINEYTSMLKFIINNSDDPESTFERIVNKLK